MKLDRTLLAAVLCAALLGCNDRAPAPDEHDDHGEDDEQSDVIALSAEAYETAGIAVAPVGRRELVPIVRVTGTLSYDERHMGIATARIGGRIARVVADYGQNVAAGSALAWIDSPELGAAQADYLRARSMLRLHEAEVERARLLVDGQAISQGELLRREADWRAAEADTQTAEQELHLLGLSQDDVERLSSDRAGAGHVYPVRAPIGGRVTERAAVPGRVVSPDDELFTVATLDSLWLFLQVFEKDLHSVHEGAEVTLTCESHPEETFRGTIDFVGQVLDPHSRTVRARAVIDNPDAELMPGMFVYASIEAGGGTEGLAVPRTAVANVEGEDLLFVEVGEHVFERRPVVLGEASGEWIELRSGVAEGESIAVGGVFVLKSELLKGGLEEHHH